MLRFRGWLASVKADSTAQDVWDRPGGPIVTPFLAVESGTGHQIERSKRPSSLADTRFGPNDLGKLAHTLQHSLLISVAVRTETASVPHTSTMQTACTL